MVRSLVNCESVVVRKELHKGDYHVEILNNTYIQQQKSFVNAFQNLRVVFFLLNLSFHRRWCEYVLKQDLYGE